MSTAVPPAQTGASQQAVIDTALLLLKQLGLSPADLAAIPQDRPPIPTFAEYIPAVAATVSAGTRRAYGTYWNRITEHWGTRRLDEPTPTEIRQLMAWVKAKVVNRRNARGGRSAQEHLVAALRCVYRHAQDDGIITEADTPSAMRAAVASRAACRVRLLRGVLARPPVRSSPRGAPEPIPDQRCL
jgi:integrase/recombinase XerC